MCNGRNAATWDMALCGVILLSNAAIFILHIRCSLASRSELVDETPKLQKIVHTKRRPARRDVIECICRDHVRHAGKQRLELPFWVEIKDPVLPPSALSRYQFVLRAT